MTTINREPFTPQDLRDWLAYEDVRKSGKFNMYDERAMAKAGLSQARYVFVMENFAILKAAVLANKTEQAEWLRAKANKRTGGQL